MFQKKPFYQSLKLTIKQYLHRYHPDLLNLKSQQLQYQFIDYIDPQQIGFLIDEQECAVWLDSTKEQGFSYLGVDPLFSVSVNSNQLTITSNGESIVLQTDINSELDYLFSLIQHVGHQCKFGFDWGLLGYFGYESAAIINGYDWMKSPSGEIPDIWLGLFRVILVWDHESKTCCLVSLGDVDVQKFEKKLKSFDPNVESTVISKELLIDRLDYNEKLKKVYDYIYEGQTYQINFTYPIQLTLNGPELNWYLKLRESLAVNYASYIKIKELSIVSLSPELFFNVTDNRISVRPIKGTRSVDEDPKKSLQNRNDLIDSKKDLAELTMITDLLRNDLGRVCEFGSVVVTDHAKLEAYPTVYHLVSTITGKLKTKVNALAILRALFPSGSVTGAPKLSSMKIIDVLERFPRQVYCGSIGYISCTGNMQFNVAIRTAYGKGRQLRYHVGGGIVADSETELEWLEALSKSAVLD